MTQESQLHQLWGDQEWDCYNLGIRIEREHQNALSRLVMEKHEAELASLRARVAELEAEVEQTKRWEPVPDGDYRGLVGRHLYVEDGGTRIGLDFNVYDCNTGDWSPMPHYTTFYHDVRLFRLVEEGADHE